MGTDFYFPGNAGFNLTFDSVRGEGRVAPRLVLSFSGRPVKEQTRVDVDQLRAEVWLETEMLGSGSMREVTAHLLHHGGNLQVVMPISRDVLRYVDDRLRADHLSLRIDLRAGARWRHESGGQVGEWTDGDAFSQATVVVTRSDWVMNVVAPLSIEEFVLIELPIPPPPDRERWAKSLGHLAEAEQFYHQGNDPEVLHRCYAAFEALAGAPKDIFALESDPDKRIRLDEALKYAKAYMHSGRHVSGASGQSGGFAVDHRDAAFALGQTKIWLSYIARLLQGLS